MADILDDLVARLRARKVDWPAAEGSYDIREWRTDQLCADAADEITRLRAALAEGSDFEARVKRASEAIVNAYDEHSHPSQLEATRIGIRAFLGVDDD